MTIRPVRTDADLEACVRIATAVESHLASIDQFRKVRDQLLLDEGGGYAYVDHSSVPESAYAMVRVSPDARRKGIGSGLVEAAAEAARTLGKDSAWGVVQPDDEASLRFAEAHGFTEASRDVELRRRLRPGDGRLREGIVELRDEHRKGAYEVSVAAVPDMVTAGQAQAFPYEEWAERELADAVVVFVALDEGHIAGYATLQPIGEEPNKLEHGFTGVRPEYRRRGVATALGEAQVAWAAERGYDELVTTTGVTNVALRRQKAKLGYEERPGPILVRGPV
jgi:mycothiol synthase